MTATLTAPVSETRTDLPPTEHFVFESADWTFYETVLRQLQGRRVFTTFDGQRLEIMVPGFDHEDHAGILGRIIEAFTVEMRIPVRGAGATTLKHPDLVRGVEADRSYYILNASKIAPGKKTLDLTKDPPPDLAIEVEMSNRLLDRVGIYAKLGVPELWRVSGRRLRVQVRQPDGTYADSEKSLNLPMLPLADVRHFLQLAGTVDDTTLIVEFQQWVRKTFNKS